MQVELHGLRRSRVRIPAAPVIGGCSSAVEREAFHQHLSSRFLARDREEAAVRLGVLDDCADLQDYFLQRRGGEFTQLSDESLLVDSA